jgi:hypothetical protein
MDERLTERSSRDLESLGKAFRASGKDVSDWTEGVRKQMSVAAEALVSFREGAGVALDRFAQGMGTTIALSTVYSKSVEEAMSRALKATAASIVSESVVQALRSLGVAFYLLALGDFTGAAEAFQSAAIWGSIGGVAAALGGALSAGGSSGLRGPRPEAARSSAPAGAAVAPFPHAGPPGAGLTAGGTQLNVLVMGEPQAAQWLATNVLNPYVDSGGTLKSSHTRRPPYAGR